MLFGFFLENALLSLALGGLVGLERERSGGAKVIGVRSFALASLFGFLLSVLATSNFSKDFQVLLQVAGLSGVFILACLYYYFRSIHSRAAIGITTALSLPFVYFIGALVGNGFALEAAAVTILTTLLLVEKKKLHAAVETLQVNEIQDGLILAVIAFVIYPLIPQNSITIFTFTLDLQLVWKLTVVASVLSFFSHMLIKYMKEKGVLLATVFGGMISSLAVVYLFGRKAHSRPGLLNLAFVASTAGAYTADLLLLLSVSPTLFLVSLKPIAVLVLFLLTLTYIYRKAARLKGTPLFSHPLSFAFVAEFLLLIFGVNVFLQVAKNTLGEPGVFLTSFLGGMASSTAAIAAISLEFSKQATTTNQATLAVLLAITGSLASKLLLIQLKFKALNKKMLLYTAIASIAMYAAYFFNAN